MRMWKQIQDDPNHWKSKYWIQRGATSKEAFGRAHAAEDAALFSGDYMGATDYTKGSDAWKNLFKGKTGTRFDTWSTTQSSDDDDPNRWTGGGKSQNMVAMQDYTAPAAKDWSGLAPSFAGGMWGSVPDLYGGGKGSKGLTAFQPWSQEAKAATLPTGLMSYTRPTIASWEVPKTKWADWDEFNKKLDEEEEKEKNKNKNKTTNNEEDTNTREGRDRERTSRPGATKSTGSKSHSGVK